MSKYDRAQEILAQEGFGTLFLRTCGYIHRKTLRKALPTVGYPEYSGVKVIGDKHLALPYTTTKRKLFDKHLPMYFHGALKPKREYGLVRGHEIVTKPGDRVVVIGGGFGISTVKAAKIVGEDGEVITYEGSDNIVADLQEVCKINGVEDVCTLEHAVIGESKVVWGGNEPSGPPLSPSNLPDCDVLDMDCQGAEYVIIRDLEICPKAMIIELHPGDFDVDDPDIFQLLEKKGYEITNQFDHKGMDITYDTMLDLYKAHRLDQDIPHQGLRGPPVIVAEYSG